VTVDSSARDVVAAAELFKALSSPLRVAMLRLLSEPRTVGSLVTLTGISQPLVSQHLRVLRGANLVVVERHGREAIYRVSDDHITHVVEDTISHARETSGG
jgi:ArsR family transcriptional regulator, zinc-responsive transcriptional repressor